jgi:electron transport complex protein RnfE
MSARPGSFLERLRVGLVEENPTFVQAIGMCPTLAVTTSAANGLGMGLAATAVLVGSNAAIAALRRHIPDEIRIPCFIVIIAGFVTVLQFFLAGYVPALNRALGIFIPLIVVNCIILGRAEAYASKNGVLASLWDGVGMGAGFTTALLLLGSIRELLGNGTLFGFPLMPHAYEPALILILAPGGFLTLGIVLALRNVWMASRRRGLRGRSSMEVLDAQGDAEDLRMQTGCGNCPIRCPMAGGMEGSGLAPSDHASHDLSARPGGPAGENGREAPR